MSPVALTHLHTSVRAEAMLDGPARLRLLRRDRWIDYRRANQALEKLELLLETPPRERMPCMVLHGDSNIGKTLIIAKFKRDHPDVLEHLARGLLRHIAPRMLIVDEVHHLLAGNYREQRASLNLLKFLANDLRFSLVVVGTSDAPRALASDPQMISRFTPFEIPRWRESDDLRRLLGAFERLLPLQKPSDLMQRAVVQFVLAASGGLTGEISRLLNDAAAMAVKDGSEQITLAHLEHAAHGE